MPRPSIDFLNARRAQMPAGAGGSIRNDRLRNPVDDRAVWESLDNWDKAMSTVDATFAEFRSWVANLPPVGMAATDLEIPF